MKKAELNIVTETDQEYWPLILPNLEQGSIKVTTETLHAIFKFSKLASLTIYYFDTEQQHGNPGTWRQLTMAEEEISAKFICTAPLPKVTSSDYDEHGFQNLACK